jgi:hypothetical protein
VTAVTWLDDDDEFLAELGRAMRASQEVPDSFLRTGRSAFAWHNIDSELARLVSDSGDSDSAESGAAESDSAQPATAGLRSERAALRSLTFASGDLTIELDVHPEALRGQVAPAGAGTIQLRTDDESAQDFAVDEFGWFVIAPVPPGPFRLSVHLDSGAAALTEWITA